MVKTKSQVQDNDEEVDTNNKTADNKNTEENATSKEEKQIENSAESKYIDASGITQDVLFPPQDTATTTAVSETVNLKKENSVTFADGKKDDDNKEDEKEPSFEDSPKFKQIV